MPKWDAGQYLKFGNERTQPAIDLLHRVEVRDPGKIMDLGCGPGNSTEVLRGRWPAARIFGLDSSPEMIAAARKSYPEGDWAVGDAATWKAAEPFDVVFASAMLHWLPNHAETCRNWMAHVAEGGALAVQQPAHYDRVMRREILEVSEDAGWRDRMQAARESIRCETPAFYYDVLRPITSRVDVWETTYYHVLEGAEGVLEWYRGTGLRPFLQALASDKERTRFEAMLLERYSVSYSRRKDGKVLFPFRRLFVVAYR